MAVRWRRTAYQLPAWLRNRPGRSDEAVLLEEIAPAPASRPLLLEPGLVLLRSALSFTEQRRAAAAVWEASSGEHGFFLPDGSLSGPKGRRGRVFDAAHAFPSLRDTLVPRCAEWVRAARAADGALPAHATTHVLMLYYKAGATLGFHRDEQANDGSDDAPVVSLSLGAEAHFAWRHAHADAAHVLALRSGDALLFGGPCRRMLHAIVDTLPTAPSGVLPAAAGGGRLSVTFRHAPEVCGQEHLYRAFRPEADDPNRATTGDELLLGDEEARERLRRMVS
jgi:alkylated DNA repair dioxygenase AlkB